MAKKWEVTTIEDMNDAQFATWINAGWQVVLATHTQLDRDTYITATFKRKIKKTNSSVVQWEEHSEEDAHTQAAQAIHPEARVFSTEDFSKYRIEWRDEFFINEKMSVCLDSFRTYMNGIKASE